MTVNKEGMHAKVGKHQFYNSYYAWLGNALDSLKDELVKLDEEVRRGKTNKEIEETIQEELNSQIAERFLEDLRKQREMIPRTRFVARWKVFKAIRYVEKNKANAMDIKMCMLMFDAQTRKLRDF